MRTPGRVTAWALSFLFLVGFAPSASSAKVELKDTYRFCVLSSDGVWTPQDFRPLIISRGTQTFAELRFTSTWLSLLRVRSLKPRSEFDIEYTFNEAGKLQLMQGVYRQTGEWVAQSKMFPLADGSFEPFRVSYSRHAGGEPIPEPEYARDPSPEFKTAKIYRTTQEIPCAGLLKDVEKN